MNEFQSINAKWLTIYTNLQNDSYQYEWIFHSSAWLIYVYSLEHVIIHEKPLLNQTFTNDLFNLFI